MIIRGRDTSRKLYFRRIIFRELPNDYRIRIPGHDNCSFQTTVEVAELTIHVLGVCEKLALKEIYLGHPLTYLLV